MGVAWVCGWGGWSFSWPLLRRCIWYRFSLSHFIRSYSSAQGSWLVGCEIGVSPPSEEELLRIRAGRKPPLFIWLSWEGSGI